MFAIEQLCFASTVRFSREWLRQLAEAESSVAWIAEDGDRIAGFAIVELHELNAFLYGYLPTIDVAPQYRRCGIASTLLRHIEREISLEGVQTLRLHVSVSNSEAIRLYEKNRYTRMGTEERFYGDDGGDAYMYEKQLPLTLNGSERVERP